MVPPDPLREMYGHWARHHVAELQEIVNWLQGVKLKEESWAAVVKELKEVAGGSGLEKQGTVREGTEAQE